GNMSGNMDKEGGLCSRPPLLVGVSNYDYWKSRMMGFLKSMDSKTWKAVLKGWEPPVVIDKEGKPTSELKEVENWSKEEDELALANSRALYADDTSSLHEFKNLAPWRNLASAGAFSLCQWRHGAAVWRHGAVKTKEQGFLSATGATAQEGGAVAQDEHQESRQGAEGGAMAQECCAAAQFLTNSLRHGAESGAVAQARSLYKKN
ncbi:gag-protease polyprotein, partial [Trifolium pratense]